MDAKHILHRDGAAEVDREAEMVLVDQLNRCCPVVDNPAQTIGPVDRNMAAPGDLMIQFISYVHDRISVHHARRQD